MALKTIRFTKEEMNSRVARFDQLQGFDGGLPDSKHPDSIRTLFNVIGFQPPENHDLAATSPVGSHASEAAAIKISEGFNLGYCKAKPGKGPMMHNHDTNETFIPMTGKWRCSWEVDNAVEYYDMLYSSGDSRHDEEEKNKVWKALNHVAKELKDEKDK